jgi:hypothetical protein
MSQLTVDEFWFSETMVSSHGLEGMQGYAGLPPGAYARYTREGRWQSLFNTYDVGPRDQNLTLTDWLSLNRLYAPTFTSCGAAMRDPRFASWSPLPIKPCENCCERTTPCARQLIITHAACAAAHSAACGPRSRKLDQLLESVRWRMELGVRGRGSGGYANHGRAQSSGAVHGRLAGVNPICALLSSVGRADGLWA